MVKVISKIEGKFAFFSIYKVYVRIILYLCNRYHAVLALRGSEGVGETY